MKRDWEIVRNLLICAEHGVIPQVDVESSLSNLDRHVLLLISAGYLREGDEIGPDGCDVVLTWAGHELLDAIRDGRVWQRCEKAIEMNDGGLPTDLLLSIARDAIGAARGGVRPRSARVGVA